MVRYVIFWRIIIMLREERNLTFTSEEDVGFTWDPTAHHSGYFRYVERLSSETNLFFTRRTYSCEYRTMCWRGRNWKEVQVWYVWVCGNGRQGMWASFVNQKEDQHLKREAEMLDGWRRGGGGIYQSPGGRRTALVTQRDTVPVDEYVRAYVHIRILMEWG